VKALSLWQPHAHAIALGLKRFETRDWPTRYRGPLAIHAAKRPWTEQDDWSAGARHRLRRHALLFGGMPMAFGAVVCVVDLLDCVRTSEVRGRIPEDAEFWGDFSDGEFGRGRYAFRIGHVRVLPQPLPVRGMQGFFDVELAGYARPAANLSLFGEKEL
jgi:hypothetical protein